MALAVIHDNVVNQADYYIDRPEILDSYDLYCVWKRFVYDVWDFRVRGIQCPAFNHPVMQVIHSLSQGDVDVGVDVDVNGLKYLDTCCVV